MLPRARRRLCRSPKSGEPLLNASRKVRLRSKAPKLSVVVCTYNRYDLLPDALTSLRAQDCEEGFLEIIVVDNSPDQFAAAAFGQQYHDDAVIRYLTEPMPGLSNARNVGTGAARANIVAFIDDDAIAAPDWARQIVDAFGEFATRSGGMRPGLIGGRVAPRWVRPKPDWLPDSQLGCLSIVDWGEALRELKPSEWVAGCNLAFDKELLISLGGFSLALGRKGGGLALLSNEEIELMDKVRASGRACVYAPRASVEHVIDPARLTRGWFRRRMAWQAVSDFIKDPEVAAGYAPAATVHLRHAHRSRLSGAPIGFYPDTDDPKAFKQDMSLAYDIVISSLAGGVEVDGRGKLVPPISLNNKLKGHLRAVLQTRPRVREFIHSLRHYLERPG